MTRLLVAVTAAFLLLHGVAVLVGGAGGPGPRNHPDAVRLLDRLEMAAKLETPLIRAFRRQKGLGPPASPPWRDVEGVLQVTRRHAARWDAFVEIQPRKAGAVALRWRYPVVGGRTYRCQVRAGIRPDGPGWKPLVSSGRLEASLIPTVRYGPGSAPPPGAGLSARIPDGPGHEPPPDRRGADALKPLREAARYLHDHPALKPVMLAGQPEGGVVWTTTAFSFTPPRAARFVVLGLDLEGAEGPVAVAWRCGRHAPGAEWLDHVPGVYRYARTHGSTVFVKRMVASRDEDRLSLVLPPPSVVSMDVTLPGRPWQLVFGVRALEPLSRAAPAPSRLVIEVEVDGRIHRLHAEQVTGRELHGAWLERRVDAAALAGRTGRIRFRVEGNENGVQVALSNPLLRRSRPGRPPAPNVLLLTIDSLRNDFVGRKAGGRSVTPHLDALAAEGVRVSHAIAGGLNTYTAVPAMMTATPVLGPGAGGFAERPPLDVPTLAGVLARSGYSVRAFIPDLYMNSFLKGFPERPRAVAGTSSGARDSARIERALRFLERHRHDPFFLWIHLDDPHLPWLPPAADAPPWRLPGVDDPGPENPAARYRTAVRCLTESRSAVRKAAFAFLKATYLAEIREADERVGTLLEGLRRLGLDRRTLVAVHADHGLGIEEDHIGVRGFTDGTLRVPLVLRFPGVLPAGSVRDDLMSLVDLAPTLLSLAGISPPPAWWGKDRSAWLRGTGPLNEEDGPFRHGWAVLRHRRRIVLRARRWRLVAVQAGGIGPPPPRLFRCRDGEDSEQDVSADHPRLARQLTERLWRTVREVERRFSTGRLSAAMKRFLEAAGYLPERGQRR